MNNLEAFDGLDERTRDALRAIADEKFCRRPVPVEGGYTVRCGSRLKADCPSCARLYANDWATIIRSGVFGIEPSAYQWVFLTLTAPSWGPTHRIPKSGAIAVRCSCGREHSTDETHLRGIPVAPSSYDYAGAVAWNRDLGRLWDATRAKLRLHLPNFEYAIIREWQARGSLHTHALLRIPESERMLSSAIGTLAASTETGRAGTKATWGKQVDSREIVQGPSAAHHVWYLSKALSYSLKASTVSLESESWTHLAALRRAARAMPCSKCTTSGGCHAKCHANFGSKSSVVSVSRPGQDRTGWSVDNLTRQKQRDARKQWAIANEAERLRLAGNSPLGNQSDES